MRGTHWFIPRSLRLRGLIPTYAGNTTRNERLRVGLRAHPHVCGEHGNLALHNRAYWGSSPRMRGTPAAPGEAADFYGLIPTYAGNTFTIETVDPNNGAHPHVCGEHKDRRDTDDAAAGSSPRMRGTRVEA